MQLQRVQIHGACGKLLIKLFVLLAVLVTTANAGSLCSDHSIECDPLAICKETENSWYCECQGNTEGDGLKGPDHTGCGKSCTTDNECAAYAECNEHAECKCITGYSGEDPYDKCTEINLCDDNPCSDHATCRPEPGSFTCTCKENEGYFGNGTVCSFRCSSNSNCGSYQRCSGGKCVCIHGYEANDDQCVDVDECDRGEDDCDQNAKCTNTDGSFTCKCNDGYIDEDNGRKCTAYPTSCEEVKERDPQAGTGDYIIDVDGTGPLAPTEVRCEMRNDVIITVLKVKSGGRKTFKKDDTQPITYYQSPDHIKEIIKSSKFCSQAMAYKCSQGAALSANKFYWTAADGMKQPTWGGASMDNHCACGDVRGCVNSNSACNCDGSSDSRIDDGVIIDKSRLPIQNVRIDPLKGKGYTDVGPVKCASKQFDIPKDCDDARVNYKRKTDGVQLIDTDGADGQLSPRLALCLITKYPHTGVTVIPHDTPWTQPDRNKKIPIQYSNTDPEMRDLIDRSFYCHQHIGYECKNSRLLNNGNKKGYFFDVNGKTQDYWGGALGETNMCSCGLTKSCDKEGYNCNCDISDGETRQDFGLIIDKEHLPVKGALFKDIGNKSYGNFTLGPLMCGQNQFGILPTCQSYRDAGYDYSYTFLIDPDGPDDPKKPNAKNQPMFHASCEMTSYPPYGITVVTHEDKVQEEDGKYIGVYAYRRASLEQLDKLRDRSVFCTQKVAYTCKHSPITSSSGKSLVGWKNLDGRYRQYFTGDGTVAACSCGIEGTCANKSHECNCDTNDNKEREDSGVLTNKGDLPVTESVVSSANGHISFGPLKCFEMFPNCNDLMGRKRLRNEHKLKNGYYFIKPDGPGGTEAFMVQCAGRITIVSPDKVPSKNTTVKGPGVDECFDIKYSQKDGKSISPAQIQSLVQQSRYCTQDLEATCVNAPLTGNHHYESCDGKKQPGWAGSRGADKCACGVTGNCGTDKETKCNCDVADGNTQKDKGSIVHKDRLAVCKVCLKIGSQLSAGGESSPSPMAKYRLGQLQCGQSPIGMGKNCQHRRNQRKTESSTMMIDTDWKGENEPFPIQCYFTASPPFGKAVVQPVQRKVEVPKEGIVYIVSYKIFKFENVQQLVKDSIYCTQAVYLECDGAILDLSASEYGVYGINNQLKYWPGNNDGTAGCGDKGCNCDGSSGKKDGGVLMENIPIVKIVLGPSNGTRQLVIENLECFDVPKTCHEIKTLRMDENPNKDNVYALDADGPGPLPIFPAYCDYKTNKKIGITVIRTENEPVKVVNKTQPGQLKLDVVYKDASLQQIHELAQQSEYCYQGVKYVCSNSPLLNNNDPAMTFYNNYDGTQSTGFGGGDIADFKGCQCKITNKCPKDHNCQCDAVGYMGREYAQITNRDVLPIPSFSAGGQSEESSAEIFIGNVECGPKPFKLPKNCQEAYSDGYKTGTILIWPSEKMDPFFVYCDMDMIPRAGVTVIGNIIEDGTPVTYGKPIQVTYNNASIEQTLALIMTSKYCKQPIKYSCRNTVFLGADNFFFNGGVTALEDEPTNFKYFGYGRPSKRECTCGRQGMGENAECGGFEDMDDPVLISRKCNCDVNDNVSRSDGGVMDNKSSLPVTQLFFGETGITDSEGTIKLGSLFCADKPFELNECETEFHDCDKNAKCVDKKGSFECKCKTGWEGLGQENKGTPRIAANGRNCVNDDECKLNKCPHSATCQDTPGSFTCTCKEGYTQEGPLECADIDECKSGAYDCHQNANCFNRLGSYKCQCKPGFRGDGRKKCERMGRCACYGDPHCTSLDGKALLFQGDCGYTLSRDNCGGEATYEVRAKFWQNPLYPTAGRATWVKEVTVLVKDHKIEMLQGGEVRIDGFTSINPKYAPGNITIRSMVGLTKVILSNGVEIVWDGKYVVEVFVPGELENSVCGICGNFNNDPEDDWIAGPACPAVEGTITNSPNQFGESWTDLSDLTCEVDCSPTVPDDLCSEDMTAKKYCNMLFEKDDNFRECFMYMGAQERDDLYKDCVYDLCMTSSDPQPALCSTAESVAMVCASQYFTDVGNVKESSHCKKVGCGRNMEYLTDGTGAQRTCFEESSSVTEPAVSLPEEGMVNAGCYCKEGFVLEGRECVRPEMCGCVFMGVYFKVDQPVFMNNCNQIAVCAAAGNITIDNDTNCHEKANCEVRDGKLGCFCIKGYKGDGVEQCEGNPCEESPCEKNENCKLSSESDKGFICECKMGFGGNCGNCSDIDECKTGTHNCMYHSDCINQEGTYRCECKQGFRNFGGSCIDEDECDEGTAECGENSKCINKLGYYECRCCDGYLYNNETQECEPNSHEDAYKGTKCCLCDMGICKQQGKVCGEDGITYENIRDMVIKRCEAGIHKADHVAIDYYGDCQATCGPVLCPKYQTCSIDNRNRPRCDCEKCSAGDSESKAVCSPGKNLFRNLCHFKKLMCALDAELEPLPEGVACGPNPRDPVGPWSQWGPCSVTCGNGVKTKTRKPYKSLTEELLKEFPLTKSEVCFMSPCPGTSCAMIRCGVPGSVCIQNENNEPICECPMCNEEDFGEPVCGELRIPDPEPRTWPSSCHLQKFACENDVGYDELHKGPCGEEPLECSLISRKEYMVSGNCSSDKKVEMHQCAGKCGKNPDMCCRPKAGRTEIGFVDLKCSDGNIISMQYSVIRECECQEKAETTPPVLKG